MSSIGEGEVSGAGVPWASLIAGLVVRTLGFFALVVAGFFAFALLYKAGGGGPGFIGEAYLAMGALGGLAGALVWLVLIIVFAVRSRGRGEPWAVRVNLISIPVVAVALVVLVLIGLSPAESPPEPAPPTAPPAQGG
jgi:hypothetical protein